MIALVSILRSFIHHAGQNGTDCPAYSLITREIMLFIDSHTPFEFDKKFYHIFHGSVKTVMLSLTHSPKRRPSDELLAG